MILAPIPPDPEPTESEIEEQLRSLPGGPETIRRRMAVLKWRDEKRKADPNAFHVRFVTNVKEFPGGGHEYEVYQQSSLWKRIRRKVLKLADHRCACCPGKANEVHHRDYRPRVLAGDDLMPLVALCRDCHHRVHNDQRGKRTDWTACERALAEMVAAKR
jgi:hypothetical protein